MIVFFRSDTQKQSESDADVGHDHRLDSGVISSQRLVMERTRADAFASTQRSWLSLVVAVAFALLIAGLAAINRRYATEAESSADLVVHTYAVLSNLNATVERLVDAETGQRGFLITGQDHYLEPYRIATADVDARVGDLGAQRHRGEPGRRRTPSART